MDLSSKEAIKTLLQKYNVRPYKGLGQNFLVDQGVLNKIIQASRLKKEDVVLEIGPGIGTLTQELAKKVKKVIAIEKDERITEILKSNLSKFRNIKILKGNILNFEISTSKNQGQKALQILIPEPYKIVANLPYNIALFVIRKFVESKNPPKEMTLMLQKEVAQKICSQKSSLPKIAIEFYAKSEILFYVSKTSFWPQPKVDGAVIKITDVQKNIPDVDRDLFFKILKAGFAHPRKTILNNLSSGLKLEKEKTRQWLKNNSISPQKRPENLTLKGWISLSNSFVF